MRGDDSETLENSRRNFLRAVGAGAAAGTLLVGRAAAHDGTVHSDGSIQDGIDAADPGDTVVVEPGTYEERVVVDVPDLTLRSKEPQAASIVGTGGETSAAVSIEADGVTVSGFEVRNPEKLLGIKVTRAGPDTARTGVTVEGCLVREVGPTGRFGVTGIIADEPQSELTVRRNTVGALRQTGHPATTGEFATVQGIFVDDRGGGGVVDSSIADNVVRDVSCEVGSIGIITNADAADLSITGNRVHDVRADSPGEPSGERYDYAQGYNVSGGTDGVELCRNVAESVTATYFNGTGLKIDGSAAGLTVEENDLLPVVGIENADDATVAATCNYWGHPKGPREAESNRSADDGPNRQDRAAVVGPVAYEPWLRRSIRNGENPRNSCTGGRGRNAGKGR